MGNKVDRESERQVETADGKEWARSHNDILFFESSAKEGQSVEQAFLEVAKSGVKRMGSAHAFSMPDSIGGASGAIKLNPALSSGTEGGNKRGATKNSSNCNC